MAQSTCIKCGSPSFEMKEANISGSNYRHFFVQCANCGGVVGLTEAINTTYLLHKIMDKLGVHR